MAETVEINGVSYTVRPLTRGQIKTLRSDGLAITQLTGENDPEKADDAIDATLEMIFGETAVAEMENPTANKLYLAVIEATYGRADDEKNLSSSGNGAPTRSGSDIAPLVGEATT